MARRSDNNQQARLVLIAIPDPGDSFDSESIEVSDVYRLLRQRVRSFVPRSLYTARVVVLRAPRWRECGVVFIHVPKNGGTSINTALYGGFMGHYTIQEVRRWAPKYVARLPTFAVARNPWARLLSAYRFARLGRGKDSVANVAMVRPERYALDSFNTFERFVLEWLPGRDLSREDLVFRPQSQFITDCHGKPALDHLGRLEDLGDTVAFLESTLGRKMEFSKINTTGEGAGEYQKAYTSEMRDIAARAYAADAWLGYDF